MAINQQQRQQSVARVLRRLRENVGLTTRQAAGIIGVTHTTISQFETERREFPSLRVEQLVKAYGYTMDEFEKILGHKSVISYKDDCVTMIERLDDEQVAAMRSLLFQLLRHSFKQDVTADNTNEQL